MYHVTIMVEYWGMEKEIAVCNGTFEPCKVIYKAEINDPKAVKQYINYMYDKNTDALLFTVSVKPIETKHK